MNNNGSCNLLAFYVQHKLLTAIHKHYSVEEWLVFGKDHPDVLPVSLSLFFFLSLSFSQLSLALILFLHIYGMLVFQGEGYDERGSFLNLNCLKLLTNLKPQHHIF